MSADAPSLPEKPEIDLLSRHRQASRLTVPSPERALIDPDKFCVAKLERGQKRRVAPHVAGVRLLHDERNARFCELRDKPDGDVKKAVA